MVTFGILCVTRVLDLMGVLLRLGVRMRRVSMTMLLSVVAVSNVVMGGIDA